jgi:hypothetical protein
MDYLTGYDSNDSDSTLPEVVPHCGKKRPISTEGALTASTADPLKLARTQIVPKVPARFVPPQVRLNRENVITEDIPAKATKR